MNYVTDVNEIKHLVCLKYGWGLPLIPRDRFLDLEMGFRKQHETHPLTVLTTSELDDLAESWAKVKKEWVI